jgi:hypothetical protein
VGIVEERVKIRGEKNEVKLRCEKYRRSNTACETCSIYKTSFFDKEAGCQEAKGKHLARPTSTPLR